MEVNRLQISLALIAPVSETQTNLGLIIQKNCRDGGVVHERRYIDCVDDERESGGPFERKKICKFYKARILQSDSIRTVKFLSLCFI